ncbi:MAG TPA: MlaD family protein [Candidatus Binataceae bacterium]|nr:MlaD family protein [Candidatus Binataceae bacterium]
MNGLKVGAPVKVRGVQIGSVSAIRLGLSPAEGRLRPGISDLLLPVIIDLDRAQLIKRGGTGQAMGQNGFDSMIKRGMRAQLRTESLLTGLLYIDLDLHPGAPLNLVIEPDSGPYREIPTVPTNLEAVQEQATKAIAKFEQIDFQALATSITMAANSINNLANSPSLKATLDSLRDATANLNKTVISIHEAVNNANAKINPLVASLQKNSQEADSTMRQTRAALVDLQSTLDPASPLAVNLNRALDQMTDTMRSVGELSDYLQRNPASLVRGRYVPDTQR